MMSWVSLMISRADWWLDTVFHNHRVIVSVPHNGQCVTEKDTERQPS